MAIELTKSDANSLIEELAKHSNKQVIVDFWAEWCGPCKAVSPLLHEIEDEDENVLLIKVNVDENRTLAADLNINSIPTLMFFQNGMPNAEPIIGVAPKPVIVGRYS